LFSSNGFWAVTFDNEALTVDTWSQVRQLFVFVEDLDNTHVVMVAAQSENALDSEIRTWPSRLEERCKARGSIERRDPLCIPRPDRDALRLQLPRVPQIARLHHWHQSSEAVM
jgi:hypothetical protein